MTTAKPRPPVKRLLAAALAALILLLGYSTRRPGDAALFPAGAEAPGALTVFVSYNFFHSDVIVPTGFLLAGHGPSAGAVRRVSVGAWTAVGWGDAAFYQGTGFGPSRALDLLRSAFWPVNPSVVRLSADDPGREVPGWRVLRFRLSAAGAERLRRRLDASFALEQGAPVPTRAQVAGAPPPETLFFRSRENASLLHVCNHWTAELLNAGGVPITPVLDTATPGLAFDLRRSASGA